jgi:hypothetical protein
MDRVAGFRVLQLLPGIGPVTAGQILGAIEGPSKFAAILAKMSVPKATAEDWPSFAKVASRLRKGKPGPLLALPPRDLLTRAQAAFAPQTAARARTEQAAGWS